MIQVLKKFLLNPWFQLAFSVLCVTASEVFLKRGAVEAPKLSKELNWTGVSGLASANVWFAILFVIVSFVTWLYVFRFAPLTGASPLSHSVHVPGPPASGLFLRQLISSHAWV